MNPKIAAYYTHGKGYKLWMDNVSKLQFWGNSLDLVFKTPMFIQFYDIDEWYIADKPTTKTSGILGGKPTTTVEGKFRITNFKTGEYI